MKIEVLSKSANKQEKGILLETFSRQFLQVYQYEVTERVDMGGAEIDLLAKHQHTNEIIFVECKAHRTPIKGEVLTKILGNVEVYDANAGWLISTSKFGSGAEGIKTKWESKSSEKSQKLRLYTPTRLIDALIKSRILCDPTNITTTMATSKVNDVYLLVSEHGYFWAIETLDNNTLIRRFVHIFDAKSESRICDQRILTALQETDTSLTSLEWVSENDSTGINQDPEELKSELDSVVRVHQGDQWADYRPARPQDFVGRDHLQRDVLAYLENVRQQKTRTRIFALKGPSGWGKSSFIIKLSAKTHNYKNRKKYFTFAVDCRAARSRRYGELAVYSAIKQAQNAGYIKFEGQPTLGGVENIFDTPDGLSILRELQSEQKIICIIFDQFEELLYKEELSPVFKEIQMICNSIAEMNGPVVVGFSWKTDGTIPTEHPAYHLWHSLADQRIEYEITPFSRREVTQVLSRFSKEIGEPLAPQIKRVLQDHCQGYPWLLKKLCIHIARLLRSGQDQNDILSQALSIENLFDKDLENLNADEYNALRHIAHEAPAEFFNIVEIYGRQVVNSLLDKRLVVRSGSRMSLYWDIFRDYIVTGKAPYIPMSYVPQTDVYRFADATRYLLESKTADFPDLAKRLGVGRGATENIVRDLFTTGLITFDRKNEKISILVENEMEAARTMYEFCRSHTVYRRLVGEFGSGKPFSHQDLIDEMKSFYKDTDFKEATWRVYATRLLGYFTLLGLSREEDSRYYISDERPPRILPEAPSRKRRYKKDHFFGEAPPESVVALLENVKNGISDYEENYRNFGRNTISAATTLGVVSRKRGRLYDEKVNESAHQAVKRAASQFLTIRKTEELMKGYGTLKGQDVGEFLDKKFSFGWTLGSKRRNGGAVKRWVEWIETQQRQLAF